MDLSLWELVSSSIFAPGLLGGLLFEYDGIEHSGTSNAKMSYYLPSNQNTAVMQCEDWESMERRAQERDDWWRKVKINPPPRTSLL